METPVIRTVEAAALKARYDGWTVDLEGPPGVGKTSIAKNLALMRGVPSYIFQMHGQRKLSDWIGGYETDSLGMIRRNNIADADGHYIDHDLLEAITHGGLYVIDEGAIGKKGRALLNWLSDIVRAKKSGEKVVLHEFPGQKIELTVHPDFDLVITNNEAGKTHAREVVNSEVASNVFFIYVAEDESADTLEGLFKRYLAGTDIDDALKNRMAENIREIHHDLKTRIGDTLGVDNSDRYYISKRELRRVANILKWGIQQDNDPSFWFYSGLRIVYESMFTHNSEKHEVLGLINRYLSANTDFSISELEQKYNDARNSAFDPDIRAQILTENELNAAFITKISFLAGQPVLLINQAGARAEDVIRLVMKQLHTAERIIDGDSFQTRLEVFGGSFIDLNNQSEQQATVAVRGKLTQDLSESGEPLPQGMAVWTRNIDMIPEELRTGMNRFLEEGIFTEKGMPHLHRSSNIYYVADMQHDSMEEFSSAFFNRWIKIGLPDEEAPRTARLNLQEIYDMLSGSAHSKLTDLLNVGALTTVDKAQQIYEYNTAFDMALFPEHIKHDAFYRAFLEYRHDMLYGSEFEQVLKKRYRFTTAQASTLGLLYLLVTEHDRRQHGNHWASGASYDISANVFYFIAQAVEQAKSENKELLEVESRLRIKLGSAFDDIISSGRITDALMPLYDRYNELWQQVFVQEVKCILGTRLHHSDASYVDSILAAVLDIDSAPPLELDIKTTNGDLNGYIAAVGTAPLHRSDRAVTPLQVSKTARVRYTKSAKEGLRLLARADSLRKVVAFEGEPGTIKTSLTEHYAQISGKAYYKFQTHEKSHRKDLTISLERDADGTYRKQVKELYRYLQGKMPDPKDPEKWIDNPYGVVIDVDEANLQPELLWMLEPIIRGERWIHPLFPGEEPFEVADNVLLILTYNPAYMSGRKTIDKRLLDRMMVAQIRPPDDDEKVSVMETLFGVWPQKATDATYEPPGLEDSPEMMPIAPPASIMQINYSHEKISAGIEAFQAAEGVGKVDIYLDILYDYLLALANRDAAKYNDSFMSMTNELDAMLAAKNIDPTLSETLNFVQLEYQYALPSATLLWDAMLEFRVPFVDGFDRYIVMYLADPIGTKRPFIMTYGNTILRRISVAHESGWENSGEALVIDGNGIDKTSNNLGWFDGEYCLVDAAKNGGAYTDEAEYSAHHELGHRNDKDNPPTNIELNAMLAPLIHSKNKRNYVRHEFSGRILGDGRSYYTQAAKGIMNGLVLRCADLNRVPDPKTLPQISDAFHKEDINAVFDIVAQLNNADLRNFALFLYDNPHYMESGNKGAYISKGGSGTGEAGGGKTMISHGVDHDTQIIHDPASADAQKRPKLKISQPQGVDAVSKKQPDKKIPDSIRKRQEQLEQTARKRSERLRKELDAKVKRLAASGNLDAIYDRMIIGGQGESEAIFGRLLAAIRAGKKTVEIHSDSGLEIDVEAVATGSNQPFVHREDIDTLEPQAVMVLMDFSASLEPMKDAIGYAVRTFGDNFRDLMAELPDEFFFDMTYYQNTPTTVMHMGQYISKEEWKQRAVAMHHMIGTGGNDMLTALTQKYEAFVSDKTDPRVRRAKKKTLILLTDAQDMAVDNIAMEQSVALRNTLRAFHTLGVEVFVVGYGESEMIKVFNHQGEHYIQTNPQRPYDIAEVIAKIIEFRALKGGRIPNGDIAAFFGIDTNGPAQLDTSNNFSLYDDGRVVDADGVISNTDVNAHIAQIIAHAPPRDISTDGVRIDLYDGTEYQSLQADLSRFIRHDEQIKTLLQNTRLAIVGNTVALSRSDHAASYAHYGKSHGATIFIGEILLRELLASSPEALQTLLRIELNRKAFREDGQRDMRSSLQVVTDENIPDSDLQQLQHSIITAELKHIIHTNDRFEDALGEIFNLMERIREGLDPNLFTEINDTLSDMLQADAVALLAQSIRRSSLPSIDHVADHAVSVMNDETTGILLDFSTCVMYPCTAGQINADDASVNVVMSQFDEILVPGVTRIYIDLRGINRDIRSDVLRQSIIQVMLTTDISALTQGIAIGETTLAVRLADNTIIVEAGSTSIDQPAAIEVIVRQLPNIVPGKKKNVSRSNLILQSL